MSRARHGDENLECKVFVGGLDRDSSREELERTFSYYGPLESVWIAKEPPGFGFVIFKDKRDADDAIRALDGTTICGNRCRVERSSGKVRRKPFRDGERNGGGGGGRDYDRRDSGRRRSRERDDRYDSGRSGGRRYDDNYRGAKSMSRSRSPRGRYSRSRSPRD